ncbi:MAG: Ig-like domain repeat protein, partial [Actinomycetes bacterium]
MTAARIPREHFAKGLRYSIYSVLALLCLVFSFSIGQSKAAAADVIDLTIVTIGPNQTVALPMGTAAGNTFTGMTINWDATGTNFSTTVVDATDTAKNLQHLYATAGTYKVTVGPPTTGNITHFGNGNAAWVSGAAYLSQVTAWSSAITNLSGAFYGATNLVAVPNSLPSAAVTDLSYSFLGTTSFNSSTISSWVPQNVTTMANMFDHATTFNQNISSWNTANVTDMSNMFNGALAFNNGNAAMATSGTSWSTIKVTTMAGMFQGAIAFNQNVSSWDTHLVNTMANMFSGATIFNNASAALATVAAKWNVSAVTNFSGMFFNAVAFNVALTSWATTAATNMSSMFSGASVFNQNISGLDTHLVTTMASMFQNAIAFNDGGVAPAYSGSNVWNTSVVTSMNSMFFGAIAFNQNISTWRTLAVTDMSHMFDGATAFNDGGVALAHSGSTWNTSLVTNMSYMFNATPNFVVGGLTAWTTTQVTNMQYIFFGSGENENLGSWTITRLSSNSQALNNWENGNFTVSNYSSTLSAWNAQGPNGNINATVVNTFYNQIGKLAINNLIGNGWTITLGVGFSYFYNITNSIALTGTQQMGQTLTYTATVTGATPNGTAPSATNAQGLWTVTGGSAASCTTTPAATLVSGLAYNYVCTILEANAGTYNVTFTYPGDTNYITPTAVSINATVVPKVTPVVAQSVNFSSVTLGSTMVFTATVTGLTGSTAPTGVGTWTPTLTNPSGNPTPVCVTTGPVAAANVATYTCTITAIYAGTYAATFTYPGDTLNYNPVGATGAATTVVSKFTPSIAVSGNFSTILPGQTETFTATLTVPNAAATPTGVGTWTVTGTGGATCVSATTPVGPPPKTTYTYTCTLTTSNPGTYGVNFGFATDNNYNAVALTSSSNSVTVVKNTPTVTFTATNPTTAVPGTNLIFTAVVTGTLPQGPFPTPTGVPTWTLSGAGGSVSSCVLVGPTGTSGVVSNAASKATYTCTVTPATVSGAYIATFTYPGDANYNNVVATADPNQTIVSKSTPTVALSSSAAPTLGSTVTITATVTGPVGGATPSGTGTWAVTGVTGITCVPSTGPVVGGTANIATYTCTLTTPKVGTYLINFTYPGDLNYITVTTSGGSTLSQVVAAVQPTVVVTPSTSSGIGNPMTFIATVSGPTANAVAPTGTGSWVISGVAVPPTCVSAGPSTSVANVSTYTCTSTPSVSGSYSAAFTFNADANYLTIGPVASTGPIVIGLAAPTISVAPSAATAALGSTFVVTATVSPVSNGATPSTTGTGTWSISLSGVPGAISCVPNSPSAFPTYITYSCNVVASQAGTYLATFTYGGDPNYGPGTVAATQNTSVAKVTPAISVTANQTTANLADLITFTAVVSGTANAVTPSSSAGIANWAITGTGVTGAICTAVTGPTAGINNATYTCSFYATKAGSYGATFSFAADTTYNAVASTASSTTTTVNKYAPTVLVTASSTTANLGDSFTFTATLTGPTNGPAFTGTAGWSLAGVTGIGCTTTTGPTGASNIGVYTCVVVATTSGVFIPVFTFNGDSNYFATSPTSGATTSVGKSAPAVAVSADAPSAALGSTVTFTATVTGPVGAIAPSGLGTWSISNVPGVASCTSTTGPSPVLNVSTYTCSVIATVTGTYKASFTFPGDTAFFSVATVTSPTGTLVSAAVPTIAISESPATLTLGGAITFTATVTGATNAVAPTGVVTFAISGTGGANSCVNTIIPTFLGNVTTYTCTVQTLAAGTYVALANYAADANYSVVSSSAFTATLLRQTPTISVTNSANPTPGGTTTLTSTIVGVVSAVQPTGAVSWAITDPNNQSVTCTPSGTRSTVSNVTTIDCTFVTVNPGVYHVTSTILGDTNYGPVTSLPLVINLGLTSATIFVSNTPSSPTVGQTLTFTALVSGTALLPAPTGVLVWGVTGAATSCSSTIGAVTGSTSSLYTCQIATPIAGTYTVTAKYQGDGNFAPLPITSPLSVVVGKATPTIAITTSPATPVFGSTITFTATVSGIVGATAPGGSVTWTINGATSTCSPLGPLGPLAGTSSEKVIFTCTIPASPAGTYTATATYSGDANYTALAPTAPVSVVVAQVTPTVVLVGSGSGNLPVTLTFTATVTGTLGATAPSNLNGGVTWTVSGTGTATLCATTPPSTTVGSVTTYVCTVTATKYGSYIVTAHYLGDINYTASVSNTVTMGVSTLTPTIGAITNTATTLGGTTTLSVVVTGSSGLTPGGAMTWLVTGPNAAPVSCSSPVVSQNIPTLQTTYSCTIPTSAAGDYLATATFPGDANFNPVSSATATINVAQATPTLSVAGVQSFIVSGQIITYTATVTGKAGSFAPTGAPTWSVTGPSAASNSCTGGTTGPVTNGVNSIYTCIVPAALAGTYTATVSVNSDSNYTSAGPSTLFQIVITQVTPLVTVTTSASSVSLGSTFTFTATVAGSVGGAAPTGTGSWSIVGVSGITCSSTTGPIVSTPVSTVLYTCSVIASSAGTYVPVFTYNGDINYSATAPTSGFTTSVAKATPTVTVAAGAANANLGTTITFTATVTGAANSVAPSATGTWGVTGVSGITTCASVTGPTKVSNVSTYTCSVVASKAGTYGATYIFPGDSDYNAVGVVSSATTTTVAAATPSVVLSSAPSTLTLGGSVIFTATVIGTTNAVAPAGLMTFTVSGTAGVTNCNATTPGVSVGVVTTYTCTVLTPHVGTYVVLASLAADSNYLAATSSSLTATLSAQAPIITLAASSNPTLGQPITLTTTVTGIAGAVQSTGQVSWIITDPLSHVVSNSCATTLFTPVSSNVSTYTCTFTPSINNTYHITSTIAADANYLTATSAVLPINLASQTPTISVVSSPLTTTTVGLPITYTAIVTGVTGNPAPGGTLTWTISGGVASTCSATTGPIPSGLTATFTCQVATPSVGSYIATATYNGDSTYSSLAPSSAVTVLVTKATPTITVASTPATPVFGGTITFTATVSGIVGATAPGGSVLWTINGATSTCSPLGALGPNAGSSAEKVLFSCTIPAIPAGTYIATATYSGDTNYIALAATSPLTVIIAKVAPTVALTSSGGGSVPSTITFTATVTGTAGASAPSNANAAANWSISGTAGIAACTTTPAATSVNAVTTYTCTINAVSYGSYVATYNYPGDVNYTALSSNTVTVGIATLTPTIGAISNTATSLGGTTTLSVVVTGSSGLTPAGSMSWVITGPSGGAVTCSLPTVVQNIPLTRTTYSCTIPTGTAGNYLATATFPGDANYNPVTSATATINVALVTPTLAVTGVQSTIVSGQIITYTATITGRTGSLAPTAAPTWTVTGPSAASN